MVNLNTTTNDLGKKAIIRLFIKNVRGKKPDTSSSNTKHDGKEGHWLETQMGIKHNGKNEPDIFGYEMKNETKTKTTFGDWSADYYLFKDKENNITRDQFIAIFGKPNEKKNNRYSWSGEPFPKYGKYNSFGQIITVDAKKNILILYNYKIDQRKNKELIVPKSLQVENLTLAKWNHDSIKEKLEKKFNQKGWFKCMKNNEGIYETIAFGDPVSFNIWLRDVKKGLIFLDSGMHQGKNLRPYQTWRSSNNYWSNLITSKY